MNLVPTSMSRAVGKTMLKSKKNSPHLFFGLGILGAVGSVVLACRATLELEEKLDEVRGDIEEANHKAVDVIHSQDILTPDILDDAERERVKEVSVVTFKGVVVLGKLYGPAIVLGGVSIACLAGSHVQLTRRNAALTAAFTAVTKAYDDYRTRVRAEVGEQRELDIYRSVETVEIKDVNGKKQLVRAVNPDGMSIYAKCYDETNDQWQNNAEFNRNFIDMQEKYANHKLRTYGHVFLNDVYKSLGFPETGAGQLVGWLVNSQSGDGYIDFGMFEARNTRFINAIEPSIWLDFNVDGIIWDKLP